MKTKEHMIEFIKKQKVAFIAPKQVFIFTIKGALNMKALCSQVQWKYCRMIK